MPKKFITNLVETLGGRLKRYRERSKMTQRELGERIGVSGNVIDSWEHDQKNHRAIDPSKIKLIAKELGLNEEEFHDLLFFRLPALNRQWLNRQPNRKQAGLLMAAYRQYSGTEREVFAQEMNAGLNMLSYWENGRRALSQDRVGAAVRIFSQFGEQIEFDAEYFRKIAARSYKGIRGTAMNTTTSTRMGNTALLEDMPDLEKKDDSQLGRQ